MSFLVVLEPSYCPEFSVPSLIICPVPYTKGIGISLMMPASPAPQVLPYPGSHPYLSDQCLPPPWVPGSTLLSHRAILFPIVIEEHEEDSADAFRSLQWPG